MQKVKWIKITTDIFDDEKIQLIEVLPDSDTIIVIWFKLLALAGKSNNSGLVLISDKVPYTKEMLSIIFRRKQSQIELALETFKSFGMIEILSNEAIMISNWERHQNIKGLDNIKEQSRIRQQRYRDNKKLLIENKDIELDKDIDIEGNVTNNVTKKIKYMDFVLLTEDEYIKLVDKNSGVIIDDMIERLNNYIGSSGKKYKSHYHTILSWLRKDNKSTEEPKSTRYANSEIKF